MIDRSPTTSAALVLEAKNLVKQYDRHSPPALQGLSFSIAQGEIFGLLGPNGAGKTTAISILSTLLRPTSGSFSICELNGLTEQRRIRGLIGLVPQQIALYSTLTARENLAYFAKLHGLSGKQMQERIAFCLNFVGLTDRANQKINTYSGGMKRRANLAVGLLHEPALLFLDEPTVGIDAQSRNMILERLAELKKLGTTLLYTTHYMEEAECLCTRVAIINEGKLVVEGAPKELVASSSGCSNLGEVFLALTGKNLRD